MNDIRVSQLVIAKTRSVSPARKLRSDVGASLTSPAGDAPCPSSPTHGFLHNTIGTFNNANCVPTITDLEMQVGPCG